MIIQEEQKDVKEFRLLKVGTIFKYTVNVLIYIKINEDQDGDPNCLDLVSNSLFHIDPTAHVRFYPNATLILCPKN